MLIRALVVALVGLLVGYLFWLKHLTPTTTAEAAVVPVILAGGPSTAEGSLQSTAPADDPEITTVLQSDVGDAFAEASQQFAMATQYPEFSQPIWDAEALQKYLPNQAAPMAYESGGVRLQLQADKFRFSNHEAITGKVNLSGVADVGRVELRLLANGQVLASQQLALKAGERSFQFSGLAESLSLFVVAEVIPSSPAIMVSVPVEVFATNSAQAGLSMSTTTSQVDGPWLRIPITVSIAAPGFYRLEGNLYSVTTGEPLVHLSSEEELMAGQQVLTLSAHIQALKVKGDEGDYRLQDIVLEQMPGPPNFEVMPGLVKVPAIDVPGHPFTRYKDEPYSDPEVAARLEFLQSMSP